MKIRYMLYCIINISPILALIFHINALERQGNVSLIIHNPLPSPPLLSNIYLLLGHLKQHLHTRHKVRHLRKGSARYQSRNDLEENVNPMKDEGGLLYLHAGLIVVLPDVLEDGVETLQGGRGQDLLPQLVVEDVQLVRHVLQLTSHLGVSCH